MRKATFKLSQMQDIAKWWRLMESKGLIVRARIAGRKVRLEAY